MNLTVHHLIMNFALKLFILEVKLISVKNHLGELLAIAIILEK